MGGSCECLPRVSFDLPTCPPGVQAPGRSPYCRRLSRLLLSWTLQVCRSPVRLPSTRTGSIEHSLRALGCVQLVEDGAAAPGSCPWLASVASPALWGSATWGWEMAQPVPGRLSSAATAVTSALPQGSAARNAAPRNVQLTHGQTLACLGHVTKALHPQALFMICDNPLRTRSGPFMSKERQLAKGAANQGR